MHRILLIVIEIHLRVTCTVQVLRANNFDPDCLRRRALPGEPVTPGAVSLWTNHRVMEWLKQVDLSEYAPNLRGSGVHGALLVHEDRFSDNVMAALLSIPASKTLLRRHLSIHFKELVGAEVIRRKRMAETEPGFVALTPTAKAKARQARQGGQFTLKRKKSKSNFDGDLLCPFTDGNNTVPTSNHLQNYDRQTVRGQKKHQAFFIFINRSAMYVFTYYYVFTVLYVSLAISAS